MRSSVQAAVSRVSFFASSSLPFKDGACIEFEIPVAEHIPDEVIDGTCRIVEAEGFERFPLIPAATVRRGPRRPIPAVDGLGRRFQDREVRACGRTPFILAEARRVPRLVPKLRQVSTRLSPKRMSFPLPGRHRERET